MNGKTDMRSLKCPNCGASLEAENGLDIFFCKFCGQKIMLEKLDKTTTYAKVAMEGMNWVERLVNRKYAEKRREREEEQIEKEKNSKSGNIMLIAWAGITIVAFIAIGVSNRNREEKLTDELTALVNEITFDIESANYDDAYIKANQLHFDKGLSSDQAEKWDATRNAIIAEIERARNNGKLPLPFGSDECKKANFQKLYNRLTQGGFSNVTLKDLNDILTGWLTEDGEIESITVDGSDVFSSGTLHMPDVPIIITYHSYSDDTENKLPTDAKSSQEIKKVGDALKGAITEAGGALKTAVKEVGSSLSETADNFGTAPEETSEEKRDTLTGTVEVDGGKLNVRETPSTDSKKIGSLKNGDPVIIFGEENGWYEIELKKDVTGWISKKFIVVD